MSVMLAEPLPQDPERLFVVPRFHEAFVGEKVGWEVDHDDGRRCGVSSVDEQGRSGIHGRLRVAACGCVWGVSVRGSMCMA